MANGFMKAGGFNRLRPDYARPPELSMMPVSGGMPPTVSIGKPPMMTGPWQGLRGGPQPGPEAMPSRGRNKRFGGPDFLSRLRAMMGMGGGLDQGKL